MNRRLKFMLTMIIAAVLAFPAVLPAGAVYAASGSAAAANMNAGAAVKKGLQKEGGKYYYYKKGVKVKKAWVKTGGAKYYFGKNGAAATGSVKINKVYYIFTADGKLLTGKSTTVKKIKGTYYQADSKGRAKSGFDKKKVYCYAKDGSRIINDWSPDKNYYLNMKGKKAKGIVVTGGLKANPDDPDDIKLIPFKFAVCDKKTGKCDKALTTKLNKLAKEEKDFAPVKEIIGEPVTSRYLDGCYSGPEVNGKLPYSGGKDGYLEYKNFAINTYKAPDGTEFFIGFAMDL